MPNRLLSRLPEPRRCAPVQQSGRAVQTNKAGDDPKDFGSPPASTELRLPSVQLWAAWVASAILRQLRLQPHPRGRRHRPFFAITQARNTSAIIAAVTPRGCREPCWVTRTREIEPSLPDRSWPHPGFRDSFVLRDPGHIKSQLASNAVKTLNRYRPVTRTSLLRRGRRLGYSESRRSSE